MKSRTGVRNIDEVLDFMDECFEESELNLQNALAIRLPIDAPGIEPEAMADMLAENRRKWMANREQRRRDVLKMLADFRAQCGD